MRGNDLDEYLGGYEINSADLCLCACVLHAFMNEDMPFELSEPEEERRFLHARQSPDLIGMNFEF